ncbi:hypothetical protein BDZ91DRAFT_719526 [Kalaharituber pfeilii]|nr:hypothetical protein BDZ91DRAFT_719526 [Kalaharituber pfeilii]
MSQGILTVYVPQLGASSPITLPVPVGKSSQTGNKKKDSKSDIDRFLAGFPSAEHNTGPDNFNINPSASDWILFDIGRPSYIHRSFFNVYLENLSPDYLASRSYILLSIQAAFRFTSNSLGTNFLDALNTHFPDKILHPTIDVFLKQQALPPWDTTIHRMSYNIVLWIPGFALPWDIIITPELNHEHLNLEMAILNLTSELVKDIPQHQYRTDTTGNRTYIKDLPQPIVPIPQHHWVLIDFETQQIIPQAFVNNIVLTMNECKTFILAPIKVSELANELLRVVKDGGVPAWERLWKDVAAQEK